MDQVKTMDMPVPQQQNIPAPQLNAPQPPPSMQSMGQGQLGSGLAQNAAILEKYRPAYMKMAIDAQMNGEEAPPFVEWAAQQQAAEPQPQPQDRRGMLQSLFNKIGG